MELEASLSLLLLPGVVRLCSQYLLGRNFKYNTDNTDCILKQSCQIEEKKHRNI